MTIRVNASNLQDVLDRSQPVAEADLLWGGGYFTTWDGAHFQVARQVFEEDGTPCYQTDDDGNQWFAMDMNEQASADAMNAYMVDHPYPENAAAEEDGAAEE